MPSFNFQFQSTAWHRFRQGCFVVVFGQLAMSMTTPLDTLFAARLGEGLVATYGYSYRSVALFMAIVTIAITRTLLPVLAEEKSFSSASRITHAWARRLAVCSIPIVIVGWFAAPLGVRLLFERGAFDHDDTRAVAGVLQWGLLQLPFYFGGITLVQLLTSQQRYKELTSISIAAALAKVLSSYGLSKFFGLPGIMVSTGIMYAVSWVLLRRACARSG